MRSLGGEEASFFGESGVPALDLTRRPALSVGMEDATPGVLIDRCSVMMTSPDCTLCGLSMSVPLGIIEGEFSILSKERWWGEMFGLLTGDGVRGEELSACLESNLESTTDDVAGVFDDSCRARRSESELLLFFFRCDTVTFSSFGGDAAMVSRGKLR